jgi:hypothetical protein
MTRNTFRRSKTSRLFSRENCKLPIALLQPQEVIVIRWNSFTFGQRSDFYALANHLDTVLISGCAEVFRIRMATLLF